jgi:nucleoside transporter
MNRAIRTKLSVMMFLEYVIWGAWLPLLTLYLTKYLHFKGPGVADFTGVQAGWILNTFAIASIVGMFVGGQLADRHFAAEKFLAFSHLVGGVSMLLLPMQTRFWPFLIIMLIHCLFYVPTLSVTNSICFANLKDAQKDFGFVRLWGTIGWIAASWPFVFILVDWAKTPAISEVGFVAWLGKALATSKTDAAMASALANIFRLAGVTSLVLAAFCLTLPKTPPAEKGEKAFAPFEAIKLLVVPSILVLFIVTFLDTVVLWCYFFWTSPFLGKLGIPANWMMPVMSIGQIAEIGTMAALGLALKKLGWRWTMTLGILGQVVRYLIYSFSGQEMAWLVVASNLVHGVCYAFFFASVYIFVDEHFPKDARVSAQGLFNLMILGIGPLTANDLWGRLGDVFQVSQETSTTSHFNHLFLVPLGLSILATLALAVFFRPPAKAQPAAPPQPAPAQ